MGGERIYFTVFNLSKQAYYTCDETQKCQYYTCGVSHIDIQNCYEKLLSLIKINIHEEYFDQYSIRNNIFNK